MYYIFFYHFVSAQDTEFPRFITLLRIAAHFHSCAVFCCPATTPFFRPWTSVLFRVFGSCEHIAVDFVHPLMHMRGSPRDTPVREGRGRGGSACTTL